MKITFFGKKYSKNILCISNFDRIKIFMKTKKLKCCYWSYDIDLSTGERPVSYFFPFLIIQSISYVKWLTLLQLNNSGEWVKECSYLK